MPYPTGNRNPAHEGMWDQTGSDIIPPPLSTSNDKSGRYASYWNAFLLEFYLPHFVSFFCFPFQTDKSAVHILPIVRASSIIADPTQGPANRLPRRIYFYPKSGDS